MMHIDARLQWLFFVARMKGCAIACLTRKDTPMKLYYSPGACSLSPHVALLEAGLTFEAIAAPTKTHKLPDGTDYYTINPLGYVPFLTLDDGRSLHEGPAIVQYIATPEAYKTIAKDRLNSRLRWVNEQLEGKQYLMGDQFTVADGYLFVVTNWAQYVNLDLTPYANLVAYRARVAARPAVVAAMKAEGLIK